MRRTRSKTGANAGEAARGVLRSCGRSDVTAMAQADDPGGAARRFRFVRNTFAVGALGVQALGLLSGLFFLLTVPASFGLVCAAAVAEGLDSSSEPGLHGARARHEAVRSA